MGASSTIKSQACTLTCKGRGEGIGSTLKSKSISHAGNLANRKIMYVSCPIIFYIYDIVVLKCRNSISRHMPMLEHLYKKTFQKRLVFLVLSKCLSMLYSETKLFVSFLTPSRFECYTYKIVIDNTSFYL